MAGNSASPIAVKTEEHSQSVLFTYFHGDIGSMVDEHFTRALSKACKTKESVRKSKKTRKSIKPEPESNSCQWGASKQAWSEVHYTPLSGRLQLSTSKQAIPGVPIALSPPDDAAGPWPLGGLGLPPMTYTHALSPGLGMTGQQYNNSLLNLLHSDRTESLNMASGSKPSVLPSWTHPGFRDPMDPTGNLDPGLEKRDLYWY
ncbi:transcription cofactor vestigial-like protein 1 [Osmerus mordax]|uniref:transcription cofactor vestigial-like protein 1 n=1 Tax=Osmerus mordax TaxID=8014 RepID=UPI0035105EC2